VFIINNYLCVSQNPLHLHQSPDGVYWQKGGTTYHSHDITAIDWYEVPL